MGRALLKISFQHSAIHTTSANRKKAFPELCEKRMSELVLNKLNPGDLIFLAGADKKQIFHVIIYDIIYFKFV